MSATLKMADAMHLVGVSAHLVLGMERDDQLVFLAIVPDRNRFQMVAAHPRRSDAGLLAIRRLDGAGIGGKLPEAVSILPQNAVGIIVVAHHGIIVGRQLYRLFFAMRKVEYPGITFALEREEDDSHSFRLLEVCQLFPFQHHSEGAELDGFGEFEFLMLAGSQDEGEQEDEKRKDSSNHHHLLSCLGNPSEKNLSFGIFPDSDFLCPEARRAIFQPL